LGFLGFWTLSIDWCSKKHKLSEAGFVSDLRSGGGRHLLCWVGVLFKFVRGTLGTAATTGLLYQPRMIGDGDCGEIGGMKIGRGS
jgi:hypothetical protein